MNILMVMIGMALIALGGWMICISFISLWRSYGAAVKAWLNNWDNLGVVAGIILLFLYHVFV